MTDTTDQRIARLEHQVEQLTDITGNLSKVIGTMAESMKVIRAAILKEDPS